MSAIIIPFGKHKGKTVEEVETLDPQYLQFLEQQEWMREKFPSILAAAASLRGDEHQRTPEHNALQMRLLDKDFRWKLARKIEEDVVYTHVDFEVREGWDAVVGTVVLDRNFYEPLFSWSLDEHFEILSRRPKWTNYMTTSTIERIQEEQDKFDKQHPKIRSYYDVEEETRKVKLRRMPGSKIAVEIKTWIGDEFPSVLRQINNQLNRGIFYKKNGDRDRLRSLNIDAVVLLTKGINASGVSADKVREFFLNADVHVLTVDEVESTPRTYFVPRRPK